MSERVCENCKWWKEVPYENVPYIRMGECHVYPPSVRPKHADDGWPLSESDDFCGMFGRPTEQGEEATE